MRTALVRLTTAYFGAVLCAMLFDAGDASRHAWSQSFGAATTWLAIHAFGAVPGANGISVASARYSLALHALELACALVVTAVWSAAARARNDSGRLEPALRLALRYALALIVMIYGGLKVVPVQFPRLDIEDMAQALGALTPMGLLWRFMGYSAPYTMFAGALEWTGAFLLFFRRTATLGALILIGVLSNVALMNYAYDVPVKQLSVNLTLMALTIAALDGERVLNVFLLNRDAPAASLVSAHMPAWLRRARPVLKPLVVLCASVGPMVAGLFTLRATRQRSPLYGMYAVQTASPAPFAGWTQVVFARPTTMTVSFGSDSVVRYRVTIDTVARTVTYRPRRDGRGDAVSLHYSGTPPEGIRLESAPGMSMASARLAPIDPLARYPLAR